MRKVSACSIMWYSEALDVSIYMYMDCNVYDLNRTKMCDKFEYNLIYVYGKMVYNFPFYS